MIRTQRLLLRPWTTSDAPELYELARHRSIGIAAGWPPHRSVANSQWVIENILHLPEVYAIVRDSQPIGCIDLQLRHAAPHECAIGYWLGLNARGRGYVHEAATALLDRAFQQLDMHTVWAHSQDSNEASRRVQRRLGFVPDHRDGPRQAWRLDRARWQAPGLPALG